MLKNSRAVLAEPPLNPEPPPESCAIAAAEALFFAKGAATAEQFRIDHAPAPATPPAPARRAPPTGFARDVRLSLRVDAALHWRVKLAAGARGQSCQALLVDALDGALAEAPATSPAVFAAAPADAARRVKLAFWVDVERRAALLMAARPGETAQAFLHAALEAHLQRLARAHRALLEGAAVETAEIIAFPRSARLRPGPVDAERRRKLEQAAACLGIGVEAFLGPERGGG